MSQGNIANLSANSWNDIPIAFDFDGTLVNCKVRQVEVLRSVLRKKEFFQVTVDFDEWWDLKREGLNTYDALIKIGVKQPIAKAITTNWIELIEEPQWLDLDGLKPDVLPFLQSLKKNKNRLYLISARKSRFNFLNQLKKLSLLPFFDEIYIVDPLNVIEKKTEVLLTIKPSFFFGDSESDYKAALSSNTNFIGVSSGQRSPDFLTKQGVTVTRCNFTDLIRPSLK